MVGSADPVGTLAQTPSLPGSAHDLQAVLQAVAQQTPWAQLLDAHSAPFEQSAPFIFLPQELPLQTLGGMQFALLLHASKHRWPLHANGAHGRELGATHWPVALQVDAAVNTLLAQRSPAQTVPGRYLRHPPAPSHLPSFPHEAAP